MWGLFEPPQSSDGRLHIIPLKDIDQHITELWCWCEPHELEDGIITHHAEDLRELTEKGFKPKRDCTICVERQIDYHMERLKL